MNETVIFVACGVALLLAAHGAYCSKVQETCLRIGSGLEGASGPTGFQDAVTPPETTRGIVINWVFTAALFALVLWQFGLVAVGVTIAVRILGRVIAGAVLSTPAWQKRFVYKVFQSMVRCQADYVKTGDAIRAKAMADLLDRFKRSSFAEEITK